MSASHFQALYYVLCTMNIHTCTMHVCIRSVRAQKERACEVGREQGAESTEHRAERKVQSTLPFPAFLSFPTRPLPLHLLHLLVAVSIQSQCIATAG
jgi:hypothetical protein